jgi:hypothetical protein
LSLRYKPLDGLDFSCDCLALETYPLGAQAAQRVLHSCESFIEAASSRCFYLL